MLLKILGGIDILAALILIFKLNYLFPTFILIIFGIIILIKSSLGFLKDLPSWIDLLCGITILISLIVVIPLIISIVLGVAILQKGITSFL